MQATELLQQQQAIETKLNALHEVLNSVPTGPMGITHDEYKTPEWRKAKSDWNTYFAMLQNVNKQLNKIRKCIGYENINGRRVAQLDSFHN